MKLTPESLAELIIEGVSLAINGPRVAGRLDALQKQLDELKAAPSLKFQGTYSDTKSYQPGDCTTRQGGLWVCTSVTTGAFDHASWQLCVKKGDAK